MEDNKRYNLILPQKLFDQVSQIAEDWDTSVVEVIKRSLKLIVMIHENNDEVMVGDTEFKIL
jgi:hypothetical protein